MNATGVKFEVLNKDNYETWKLQMRAVLIKNDAWGYVSGTILKPEVRPNDAASADAERQWIAADLKAQSDIILAMNPSEIKQTKGCTSSHAIWQKLEAIYQSKGPARKAALLNHLMSLRLQDGGDARDHSRSFFDTVDRLSELDVEINQELLAVMLLRSLPEGYENFRCAISSRDELPSLEMLKIKIAEEYDARKETDKSSQSALYAGKTKGGSNKREKYRREKSDKQNSAKDDSKIKCHKCGLIGHRAKNCQKAKKPSEEKPAEKSVESVCLAAVSDTSKNMAAQAGKSADRDGWCVDSGCTSHVCKNIESFTNINRNIDRGKLNLANSAHANIEGLGNVSFEACASGERKAIELSDTLFVPDLRANLISVGKITDKGHKVVFSRTKAEVVDRADKVLLTAKREGGLYYLSTPMDAECRKVCEPDDATKTVRKNTLENWHIRMGHLNIQSLREAIKKGYIRGIDVDNVNEDFQCQVCLQGKMCRPPFPKASERVTTKGQLTHSDVCGPMRVASLGNKQYFVTFIDDFSGWCEVRFISHKNQVMNEFESYRTLVSTQHGVAVKCLQSDNGREYVNQAFDQLLSEHGILRRLTAPYNPEQNGVAERRNRTLMDMARCLLIQSGLPQTFWAEAVNAANYIRNRSPTSKLDGKTPHEAWFGEPPDVSTFRRFGCEVFVMDRSPGKGKLEARSRKGILVGYSSESKAYRIWLPEEMKIETSRDIRFVDEFPDRATDGRENCSPRDVSPQELPDPPADAAGCDKPHVVIDLLNNQDTQSDIEESPDEDNSDEDEEIVRREREPENAPRRGRGRPRMVRTGRPGRPAKVYQEANYADEGFDFAFLSEIPVSRAMASPELNEWNRAMADEVKSILKKDTWSLADRPKESSVIGSRFVLRNKYGSNGVLERRKARIVAKGYAQQYGKDFHETYAPVARLSSIRSAVAFAAKSGMHIRQYDVTTAYLNGELEETVYMEVPDQMEEILRCIVKTERNQDPTAIKAKDMLDTLATGDKVCLMKKALYGLKQAGRAWNKKLDRELRTLGANPTNGDSCVYVRRREEIMIVIIYVDDLLVMCRDMGQITSFGRQLANRFEVKDLGDLKRCLGMDFTRNEEGIHVNQQTYIDDVLLRFGMSDCNAVSTPLDVGTKLAKGVPWSSTNGSKPPYRELVGCLLYLSQATRPDIAHAASVLGQFDDCFNESHWSAAKRVLRYLKGTNHYGVFYRYGSGSLTGYTDADWGGSIDDRRSFTGYVFVMNGGAVAWDSKKQRTVALSSTEAEYMALSEAAKEAMHLRRFLLELGAVDSEPVRLFNDNVSAQKLATNPVFHARTKHIDVRHHFVREVAESGQVTLGHVASDEMPADVLTKALPRPKHQRCLELLGLKS